MKNIITTSHISGYNKPARFDFTAEEQLLEILKEQGFNVTTREATSYYGKVTTEISTINDAKVRVEIRGSRLSVVASGVYGRRSGSKPPAAIALCGKKMNLVNFVTNLNAVIEIYKKTQTKNSIEKQRNEQLLEIKVAIATSGFSIIEETIDFNLLTFCRTVDISNHHSTSVIKLKVAHTPEGFQAVRFSSPLCADANYMKLSEVGDFNLHVDKAREMISQIQILLHQLSEQFKLIQ